MLKFSASANAKILLDKILKMNILKKQFAGGRAALLLFLTALGVFAASAQSTNSAAPTPITTNEISGTIRARDIGDARLTAYYYTFDGTQGDIFVNVTANNFNGDIDIFTAEGLRPLSKIRLYADSSPAETGRIVYLRQPLRLILRIEGRTPDDNNAAFNVKFAGSFAAIKGATEQSDETPPQVESAETGTVKVNSVGTIIETKPEAKAEKTAVAETETSAAEKKETVAAKIARNKQKASDNDNKEANETRETVAGNKKAAERKRSGAAPEQINRKRTAAKTKPVQTEKSETASIAASADPLENLRLVVLMKDGAKTEYPMTEVFRFSLGNNVLTIVLKDGKIERRSIFDVQRFSVE